MPPGLDSSAFAWRDTLVGIGEGAKWVCERNEDEIWFGEKPRTTLWQMETSALVSDPNLGAVLLSLSTLLIGAVEEDDSEEWRGTCTVGEAGRGVMSVDGKIVGTASAIVGDNGSKPCFSLIE